MVASDLMFGCGVCGDLMVAGIAGIWWLRDFDGGGDLMVAGI